MGDKLTKEEIQNIIADLESSLDTTFNPIYCSHCGRFLGYTGIDIGGVMLFCPSCKGWTQQIAN